MRIFRPHPVRLARALVCTSLFALAACGGGGSSGSNPVPFNGGSCDPGTSISLSFPNNTNGNFPSGVPTNIGRIEIVANGNNNTIFNSFTQFDTVLVPNNGFGNVQGGFLTLTSDNGGPHPYTSDFYYNSSIPTLQPGVGYTVYINVPSNNCQPIPFGQFAT